MTTLDGDPREQVYDDYESLWNGDYSKFDVVADDVSVYDPAAPGGSVHGRDDFEAFLRGVREGFPDFHIETEALLADEDRLMLEWTATGTHEGTLEGLPPTGRSIEVRGMSTLVIEDGAVREDRLYYDYHAFMDQLGLTFPSIVATVPRLLWAKVTGRG